MLISSGPNHRKVMKTERGSHILPQRTANTELPILLFWYFWKIELYTFVCF